MLRAVLPDLSHIRGKIKHHSQVRIKLHVQKSSALSLHYQCQIY